MQRKKRKRLHLHQAEVDERAGQGSAPAPGRMPRVTSRKRKSPALEYQRVVSGPAAVVDPAGVLALQRTVGNQTVQRLLAQRQEAEVRQRMAPNVIALKKRLRRLDFVRLKRKHDRAAQKFLSMIKLARKPDDAYGHWWLEIGDFEHHTNWDPKESFGWWPTRGALGGGLGGIKRTFSGVPGILNRGEGARDPHHGDAAEDEFHPAYEVDDNDDYDAVRSKVIGDIQNFAYGFEGSWNWRLGWGKNCHSFQQRLKTAVGLHNKHTNRWFNKPEESGSTADVLTEKRNERLVNRLQTLGYNDIGEDLFDTGVARTILRESLGIAHGQQWLAIPPETRQQMADILGVSVETLKARGNTVFHTYGQD